MIQGHKGLYVLYRRDKLYYVGLASNLRRRINQHLTDKIAHPDRNKCFENREIMSVHPHSGHQRYFISSRFILTTKKIYADIFS